MVGTDLIVFEFQLSHLQTKQSTKNTNKMNQFRKVGIEMNLIEQKFGIEIWAVQFQMVEHDTVVNNLVIN